eukprot:superscaffoldBa00014223_g26283
MSGIATALQLRREKDQGVGSNSRAVKYLNQDYEALRRRCLETGRLFQDETFEALPSSLGFNELGPGSYKIRGVSWQRPTELTSDPQFIVSGASRTDICQGALVSKICKKLLNTSSKQTQSAGEQLENSWRPAGDQLETSWRTAGEQLENSWRTAGDQLETSWRTAGEQLENSWRPAGDQLENSCISADILISVFWPL